MTIYLVRHGYAGTKAKWKGDDTDRALNHKGIQQANDLVKLLADRPITRAYSSPSRRCVQTIEALAEHLGTEVKVKSLFGEDANPGEAIAFLLDRSRHDLVVCSHGGLIPKIIRRLIAAGMRTSEPNLAQKGSVWEIRIDKGKAVKATYHPPGRRDD